MGNAAEMKKLQEKKKREEEMEEAVVIGGQAKKHKKINSFYGKNELSEIKVSCRCTIA